MEELELAHFGFVEACFTTFGRSSSALKVDQKLLETPILS